MVENDMRRKGSFAVCSCSIMNALGLNALASNHLFLSHAHGSTAPLACVRLHLVLSPLAGCGGSLSIHAFFWMPHLKCNQSINHSRSARLNCSDCIKQCRGLPEHGVKRLPWVPTDGEVLPTDASPCS